MTKEEVEEELQTFKFRKKFEREQEFERPNDAELRKMAAESNQVLKLLNLNKIEMRALKNKLSVNTIRDILVGYGRQLASDSKTSYEERLCDCLVSRSKTESFINIIKQIQENKKEPISIVD